MESIDLSNRGLTTLPDEELKMTSLRSLNLSGNRLSTLPAMYHLSNLDDLNLRWNQFTEYPARLHPRTNADLRNNPMMDIHFEQLLREIANYVGEQRMLGYISLARFRRSLVDPDTMIVKGDLLLGDEELWLAMRNLMPCNIKG